MESEMGASFKFAKNVSEPVFRNVFIPLEKDSNNSEDYFDFLDKSESKMTLIDHSVFVFMAISVHTLLLWKTDYFGGKRDIFGPEVRRGPHFKPKPEKS